MKTTYVLSVFFIFALISVCASAAEKEYVGLISKNPHDKVQVSSTISLRDLTETDRRILSLAKAAARECAKALETAVEKGVLTEAELFSTLYFPILPIVYPPAFSTFYDRYTDEVITPIVDSYLARDSRIIAVGLVDRNGYLPSHNSKYSQQRTGNAEIDIMKNRTKRIYNDIAGIRAAKNTSEFLLQTYRRDTGEIAADVAVPVFVLNRHWGALRIMYNIAK